VIGRTEIDRAFNGAWGIFTNRPDAMRNFDVSLEGFWRSFQALLVVAPVYFITSLSDQLVVVGAPDSPVTGGQYWASEVLTLVLDWVALPALLALIGGFVGIRKSYLAYIVVRNWAQPLMLAPFALLSVLAMAGLSSDLLLIPSVVVIGYSLRFSYLIVRRTLGVEIDVAIAFVALDVLTSLLVVRLVGKLTGVDPFG
jgi:hypothetical protein